MSSKQQGNGLEPGMNLDKYRLERRIGKGAFGEVWLAMDAGSHGFRKHVALKVLSKRNNERRVQALIREARICGALNHPNIIDVFGVEHEGDRPFIIMEYVEGETLASLWGDLEFLNIRVPRSIIIDVGIAICEALHHAWTATNAEGDHLKIVHRDLKPANVIISNRGIVKLGDFGVAKIAPDVDDHMTRAGKLKGTPSYLAPELWRGDRNFRPGMDLWSLGIILWELAAGERFYKGARTLDIYKIIKKRPLEDEMAAIEPHVPKLAPIVRKLLQRDADNRYQDALEVAEELRWARMAQPVSGDPLQFSRLVRASRVSPEDRAGSIASLPALPEWLDDWQPLLDIAREDPASQGVRSAVEDSPTPGKPAKSAVLGPATATQAPKIPTTESDTPPPSGKPEVGEEDATQDGDVDTPTVSPPAAASAAEAAPMGGSTNPGDNPLNDNPDSSDPGDAEGGKLDTFFGGDEAKNNAAMAATSPPKAPKQAAAEPAASAPPSKPRKREKAAQLVAAQAEQQKLKRLLMAAVVALVVVSTVLIAVVLRG